MITTEILYEAYMTSHKNEVAMKDQLKTLRIAGETAATFARHNTVGSMNEKLAAIRATWAPFNEAIAETERTIATCVVKTEEAYDAYVQACIEA